MIDQVVGGKAKVPSVDVGSTAIAGHYNLLGVVHPRAARHLWLFGGDGPILEALLAAAAEAGDFPVALLELHPRINEAILAFEEDEGFKRL